MKPQHAYLTIVLTGCLMVLWGSTSALAAGLLTPKGGGQPTLEIKDHRVKVVIEDGYSITSVEQLFHNPHNTDLEALYSFPVPEKAAVSEFTMWIDGKPVQGEVFEKKKAREIYEDQKAKGNDTGLTEKNSYKNFEIYVSPVRSNSDTKIRITYIQPNKVDTDIGRYVYPLEEGGVDIQQASFWSTNSTVASSFSFDLILKPSYPVADLRLPNQPNATVNKKGNEYHIHLGNTPTPNLITDQGQVHAADDDGVQAFPTAAAYTLDKDIVLYYRHAENLSGSVDLVTYKPEKNKRGTFMLTVTPGMDLQPITEGRDWIFILDISGSMEGKYQTLAEGVSQSLQKMSANERFKIILFNDHGRELTKGYTNATPENVAKYVGLVKGIHPGGGTNVYDGLAKALDHLDADRTSAIMLVTDGVANVGVKHQKKFIELIKSKDVRLYTFVMGNSANRPLLTALTRVSDGFSMSVSNSDDIVGTILMAKAKVTHQALHGAKLDIKGIKIFDVTPEEIGSLYRGQQLIIFGHYYGNGAAKVTLQGKISGQEKKYTTHFDFPEISTANPEIERLWAYATIERLSKTIEDFGNDKDLENAITDIGVEYGLVTDYTSMVVVRNEVFEAIAKKRTNQKRVQVEHKAQAARKTAPIVSKRADQSKPMFKFKAPSVGSGGGAFGPWSVALLLPLIAIGRRRK